MDAKTGYLPFERAVGDLLGIVRCLDILNQTEDFEKWLSGYHNISITENYFPGYRMVFSTLIAMLVSAIHYNTSLQLSEDEVYSRSRFRGINIRKIPNTCEKTILVKNIVNYADKLEKSTDWDSFKSVYDEFCEAILHPLQKIQSISSVNPQRLNLDLNTIIDYNAIFHIYLSLNDTSRGIPHGYVTSVVDLEVPSSFKDEYESFAKNFVGYKYGIQYLWSCLLENFSQSVVKDIHKTEDPSSFDKYFYQIREMIIRPIEKATGVSAGFDNCAIAIHSPKSLLWQLINVKLPNPSLSFEEQLQQFFLWYPIKLVDSSEYTFTGIPALFPLLMGLIQIKRRASEKSQAKLIRIIHGEDDDHRRNYSYAVLLEIGGYISDSSGWLLFYDTCSDRGSTSGLFENIETLIDRYESEGFVDISNLRIDQQEFMQFIRKESLDFNSEGKY